MYKRIAGCSGALREKPDFPVSVADCVLAPLLTPSVRGLLPSTSAATFYSIFSVIILFLTRHQLRHSNILALTKSRLSRGSWGRGGGGGGVTLMPDSG